MYTCGSNTHGQLGHGDTTDRAAPKIVELFKGPSPVVQVAAGASYTFAVTDDGTVYSFGSCTNFCLGHGDQHNELLPRAIQSFKRRNILVVRVSAGDEHAVALDALGYVSILFNGLSTIFFDFYTLQTEVKVGFFSPGLYMG